MSISVQTERMLTDRFALLSIADVLGEQLGRCTKADLGAVLKMAPPVTWSGK